MNRTCAESTGGLDLLCLTTANGRADSFFSLACVASIGCVSFGTIVQSTGKAGGDVDAMSLACRGGRCFGDASSECRRAYVDTGAPSGGARMWCQSSILPRSNLNHAYGFREFDRLA